jgi:hypothetical protein
VATEEDASWRLIEQRMRNRVMEVLEMLADGAACVRFAGASEYFEMFFDWVDDRRDWRTWSSFTAGEVEGLARVHGLMEAAARATPQHLSDDELIASGWPGQIQPVATEVLQATRARGRFREDAEETEPSA